MWYESIGKWVYGAKFGKAKAPLFICLNEKEAEKAVKALEKANGHKNRR